MHLLLTFKIALFFGLFSLLEIKTLPKLGKIELKPAKKRCKTMKKKTLETPHI